ncbi:MAG: AAA family ATPase [Oceanicaulis sp.]
MRIEAVEVQNFRGLNDQKVRFDPHTVIVGENNTAKSALLKAIDLFFENAPKVYEHDFHSQNHEQDIEIKITFRDLTPGEADTFQSNMTDDKLVVTRVLQFGNPKSSGRFFVDRMTNPKFEEVRAVGNATEKRNAYKSIQAEYGLPNVGSAAGVDDALDQWEAENPDKLEVDRAGFRGFTSVAADLIKQKTSYVFVPALLDVSDELSQSSKSPLRELLNAISKQIFENNKEIANLREDINERYAKIADPQNFTAFENLSSALSGLLSRYYSDAGLNATWTLPEQISIPVPQAHLLVKEADEVRPASYVGHGLQRAVIITLLEYLAQRSEGKAEEELQTDFGEAQSDIIIAIEEPEAFQHPTKQRLFSEILRGLSDNFSRETGIRVQVMLVSHNPLFIDVRNFNEVRHFSKDEHRAVTIRQSTIERCAEIAAAAFEYDTVDVGKYGLGLHVLTPEIAEGFFARKVVLVEGVGDKAIILGAFHALGENPLADGIYVVPTDGKTKIDKPLVIFGELGISVYVVLDNDQSDKNKSDANVRYNRAIQVLVGCDGIEDYPVGITERLASFDGNLEAWLASIYGDAFEQAKGEIAKRFDLDPGECCKSPLAAGSLIKLLQSTDKGLGPISEVLESIRAL